MELDSITGGAASRIAGAIRDAARATGASFEYLLTTARIESNLNPGAQATTSSARGLYQFIEQTWLATLKQAGPALGLGQYSAAIAQDADGRYEVPDTAARREIMRLRSDPVASAMMAGVFTRSNDARLAAALGRKPSPGELYIAHFLGPDGAAKLIGMAASHPRANAAAAFPSAAHANRGIFYDRYGRALGAGDVYAKLAGRYEVAHALAFSPAERAKHAAAPAPRPPPMPSPMPSPAPDTAGVTRVLAEARAGDRAYKPAAGDTRPLFQAMFTDMPRRGVSETVNSLWTPARRQAPAGGSSRLLDLFKDDGAGVDKLLRGKV
jgi:hypothetical protein